MPLNALNNFKVETKTFRKSLDCTFGTSQEDDSTELLHSKMDLSLNTSSASSVYPMTPSGMQADASESRQSTTGGTDGMLAMEKMDVGQELTPRIQGLDKMDGSQPLTDALLVFQ